MASSQDLVPTGQNYGDRKANVAAMQAAGVPLSSGAGGGSAPPSPSPPGSAAPGPLTPATPINRAGLGNFDALANRQPTEGFSPNPQRQVMFQQVRESPNQVMRSIFRRMRGYKEG